MGQNDGMKIWGPGANKPRYSAKDELRKPTPLTPQIISEGEVPGRPGEATFGATFKFALICGLGVLCMAYFMFSFDISVETDSGHRVVNLGLIADRQNGIIAGGFVALLGLVGACFSELKKR